MDLIEKKTCRLLWAISVDPSEVPQQDMWAALSGKDLAEFCVCLGVTCFSCVEVKIWKW